MSQKGFFIPAGCFLFLTLFSFALFLASCGKKEASPPSANISCNPSRSDYQVSEPELRLSLDQLAPGLYEYVGSRFYYESKKSSYKIQVEEWIKKDPQTNQFFVEPQFICRENYSKKRGDSLSIKGSAPRFLKIPNTAHAPADFVERHCELGLHDGYPRFMFSEEQGAFKKMSRTDLAKALRSQWDEFYFVNDGVKRYSFIARKELPDGTLYVRMFYSASSISF